MAVDAMGSFSGISKEIETIVSLIVNKIINKMNLVRRDEFEVLKKIVGIGANLDGSILIVNLLKLNFRKVSYYKKKNCI